MTNTPNPSAIDTLAAFLLELLELDCDILALLELMRPLMTPTDFTLLCDMIELCPLHICDYHICADDDEPSCRNYRD